MKRRLGRVDPVQTWNRSSELLGLASSDESNFAVNARSSTLPDEQEVAAFVTGAADVGVLRHPVGGEPTSRLIRSCHNWTRT